MNCPVCNVNLTISDRQGVEIDFCPKCRGVWLDRGELDKLIERASTHYSTYYEQEHRPEQQYKDKDHQHGKHRHHKRESFWSEIFD